MDTIPMIIIINAITIAVLGRLINVLAIMADFRLNYLGEADG